VDEAECARHPFEPEAPQAVNAVLDDGAIVDWWRRNILDRPFPELLRQGDALTLIVGLQFPAI
jgi:hypothetical protein